MDGEKLIVIDSDSRAAELAVIKLSNAGYWVISAGDAEEAIGKISNTSLDLVLISLILAKQDGYEICAWLRKKPEYKNVPIILMVDERFDEAQYKASGIVVDDILTKPFSPKHLLSKVNAIMAKTRLLKEINPLTELPGKIHIQEKVNTRLALGESFALIFCDLKGFKIYNKYYGFEQGDQVIKATVNLIKTEIDRNDSLDAELFHFGGDDFCILTEIANAEELCKKLLVRFDQEIPQLYLEEDRNRGGLVIKNRQGIVEQWPIMTIALGVVNNQQRRLGDWLEAELVGAEMLKYAKSMPGSQFSVDRRRS